MVGHRLQMPCSVSIGGYIVPGPVKRIALDALDSISDPSVSQLRRCANTSSCGWLFLDTSKNQRRRWCAMETCGTAAKMKRYRRSHA
jgi:predicted RNA-binding Zn ribbon-like protein